MPPIPYPLNRINKSIIASSPASNTAQEPNPKHTATKTTPTVAFLTKIHTLNIVNMHGKKQHSAMVRNGYCNPCFVVPYICGTGRNNLIPTIKVAILNPTTSPWKDPTVNSHPLTDRHILNDESLPEPSIVAWFYSSKPATQHFAPKMLPTVPPTLLSPGQEDASKPQIPSPQKQHPHHQNPHHPTILFYHTTMKGASSFTGTLHHKTFSLNQTWVCFQPQNQTQVQA